MNNEDGDKMEDRKPGIFERAIFGSWEGEGLKRHKGLLEQATDNETSFLNINKQFAGVKKKLHNHERLLKAIGLMSLLPALNSAGVNTKDLIPYIIKVILSAIHL